MGANELFDIIINKGSLKQGVYNNTFNTFRLFKKILASLTEDYGQLSQQKQQSIPFVYSDKGDFQFELEFAGDLLVFMMHTNIFEFSRYHEVMNTQYIRDNKERSYCGMINIYNFLADSFRYNRTNDIGYLIGRIFINKDLHYFIEGKREIGYLFNNFGQAVMDENAARQIIESAILYTVNFDLLTPPFENVKEVTVLDLQNTLDSMKIQTGKRLGFKFQGDHEELTYPSQ
jgi:hypothetical protein